MRRLLFALPLLLLLLQGHAQRISDSAAPSAPATAAHITLGPAAVPLAGLWQFRTGDNPTWALPGYDDSSWQSIRTGESWETQGHRNYTGFAWYRKRIVVTSSAGVNPAIMLPTVQDAAEIYWNGVLVGSYGKVPPSPVWSDDPLYRSHDSISITAPFTGVLAIRVWKAPHIAFSSADEGGLVSTPLIGSQRGLASVWTAFSYSWLRSSLYGLGLAVVSAILGLLALLAWLRDRRQWMLFWAALYLLHPIAMLPFADSPTYISGLLSFRWAYGLVAPVVGIGDVALWFLLLYLLGLRENTALVRWTVVLSILDMAFNLADGGMQLFHWWRWPEHVFLICDVGLTIPALLIEAYALVLIGFAFRKRLDAARWFLAISALLSNLILAAGNWFGLGARWTHSALEDKINAHLFSIAGSRFSALVIANSFLLAAIAYAVWQYSVEQNQRRSALEQEYRSAQELQQLMIPARPPATPGFAVESVYLPAGEVGGDFFQVLPADDGSLLIVAGDVSGKGLKAAMTVSVIIGSLRGCKLRGPAEVLAYLNQVLHGQITGFVTCGAALIDPEGAVTLANAGNPAPYLNGEELAVDSGLPLGILADSDYLETKYRLEPGDRLTFVSDGVVEATNRKKELFGFDRTQALSTQSVDVIAAAAQQFGQQDDISVLAITRVPALEVAPT
ncbi:MAG: SpoIIE family protein phosphatase [Acidobacteriaceae bacterium]